MSMTLILVYIAVGLVLLYFGAEALVKGAARLAFRTGITALVVGLTVVAFGTSMPEAVVSVQAALSNNGDISIGNVVGSNIFNIAVILGLAALIFPIKVNLQILRVDGPIMLLVTGAFLWVFFDANITRQEAAMLLGGIVAYTLLAIVLAKKDAAKGTDADYTEGIKLEGGSLGADIVFILIGLGLLVGGGHCLVKGAVALAKHWGVSEAIIGLTIVAAGTSLPELATSVVAALRKQADIAVGNIIGSNIFNILFILGIAGLINPLTSPGIGLVDIGVMLGVSLVLLPLMWSGYRINRWEGLFLLAAYGGYLYHLWPKSL